MNVQITGKEFLRRFLPAGLCVAGAHYIHVLALFGCVVRFKHGVWFTSLFLTQTIIIVFGIFGLLLLYLTAFGQRPLSVAPTYFGYITRLNQARFLWMICTVAVYVGGFAVAGLGPTGLPIFLTLLLEQKDEYVFYMVANYARIYWISGSALLFLIVVMTASWRSALVSKPREANQHAAVCVFWTAVLYSVILYIVPPLYLCFWYE